MASDEAISVLEASALLIDTFSSEYWKLLTIALKDPSKYAQLQVTIRNENFFFALFTIDSYIDRQKFGTVVRASLFNHLVDGYFREHDIPDKQVMDRLINNRMDEYAKAFNVSAPSAIDEIVTIHGQLIAKAIVLGSSQIYVHGESPVETELLLLTLIREVDAILIQKLYKLLPMLKEALTQNLPQQPSLSARSMNAHFCHDVLPSILFKSKESVLDQFFAYPEQTVTKLWQFSAETLKTKPTSAVYTTVHSANDAKIVFINMPEPKRPTDCFYCAIVFHYDKRLIYTAISKVVYYTLELGIDIITNQQLHFMCRWEDESKHVNLGQQVDYTADNFHKLVRQMELL